MQYISTLNIYIVACKCGVAYIMRNFWHFILPFLSEKLQVAKEHGCYGVIHWPSNAYEQQLVERTRNACPEGIDVVVDFVSSPRTISRALQFLNKVSLIEVFSHSNTGWPSTSSKVHSLVFDLIMINLLSTRPWTFWAGKCMFLY